MDGHRFDALTKSLSTGVTRRRVARVLAGGITTVALSITGRKAAAAPNACAVYCADQPGPRKAACKQACRECGNDPTLVCHNFDTGQFTCCPTGEGCFSGVCCANPDQVCFGPNGATCCAEGTFCMPDGTCGPPATCGPESGCLGGTCASGCFCVSSVEGDGACVNGAFADCGAPPCMSSADCGDGGVCVDATACCGTAVQVCFPAEAICASGGAATNASSSTARSWH